MGLSAYQLFHTSFFISFLILIFITIWGGIVCVIWEPQQVSTGWVVELPTVQGIYFPKDDLSASQGIIETRTELRRPTKALRNSYIVFFSLNVILGSAAEVVYFLNFDKSFVCVVMVWAVIGFINTGAVGAVNSKFLKDFLTDLGNREGEVLKIMELDLMFNLFHLRTNLSSLTETEERLETILNATIKAGTVVRKRDHIKNITITTPEAEVVDRLKETITEAKKKESEIVKDLKKVASKIGGLKYLKSCYSELACNLAKHYSCIYCVSIISCAMYIALFCWACHTGCCGLPSDEQPTDHNHHNNSLLGYADNLINPNILNVPNPQHIHHPVPRSILKKPNRPEGDSVSFRANINNNTLPESNSDAFFASASPSLLLIDDS